MALPVHRGRGMADLSRGVRAALSLLACLAVGCSSSSRIAGRRALVAAGEAVRARETGHTHEEVLREYDLFVQKDVDLVREKALAEKSRVAAKYRWVYVGGAALGVAGVLLATGGSDDKPFANTAISVLASAAGFGIGIAGGVMAGTQSRKLDLCREELQRGEESLGSWVVATFRPTAEPLTDDLWKEYVRRTHELRGLESCMAVP